MIPFIAGAGLSILSSIYQNKAIEETAESNYSSAVARAEREAMAQRGQLMAQSRENSIAVNQERYNLQREAMRERASESVQTAEGGFSGVLAQRLRTATDLSESQEEANININEELSQDRINAQAYGVEQGRVDRIGNAQLARHNALASRKTGLDLVTGAVAGGATGMQVGKGLGIGGAGTVNSVATSGSTGVLMSDANPHDMTKKIGNYGLNLPTY